MLRCRRSSWSNGLICLGVASRVGVMESRLKRGPLGWGGLPRFTMATQVGVMDSHTSVWPLKSRDGLLHFSMVPRVGAMDSHALVQLLKLGRWTRTLQCGPVCWGDGLPRFNVALQNGVMDTHSLVWPLKLGSLAPILRCGLSSWGHGLPHFSVAPQPGLMESHALVWPLSNHPPNAAKKSQQFGRTIRRAYFSAKCFPITRIMAPVPQTHCPFGCCVVGDMWKPLLAEKHLHPAACIRRKMACAERK